MFQEGKAAFYIDASLFGPTYEQQKTSAVAGNVGYTILPPHQGQSVTGHWLWGLGIARRSTQPEAAWLFVQWATSPEIEPKIALATGGAPRFSSWIHPSPYTQSLNVEYALAVQIAMQTSHPTAVLHPHWNQLALGIAQGVQKIYHGQKPKVVAADLQQQALQIMG